MTSRIFAGAAAALALSLASSAFAAPIAIGSFDYGWYKDNGSHDPDNTNTVTGWEYRSFYAFDLRQFAGKSISSITINFPANGEILGVDTSKTLTLYDFSGSITSLLNGTGGTAAWADLGSGSLYGTKLVTNPIADYMPMPELTFSLNSLAVNDAIAAANSSSGGFVIGASLMAQDSGLWAFSGQITAANLIVELADSSEVPEPASVALLGIGLAVMIGQRRRKDTREQA